MLGRSSMLAAALAAGLTASMGQALAPRSRGPVPSMGLRLIDGTTVPVPLGIGVGGGRGKGGNRPHHSSSRFVAQDKRDARKRRNGGKVAR